MKMIKIGTLTLLVALVAGTVFAQWDWIDPSRGRSGYRQDNVVAVFVDDEKTVLDREDGVWVRRAWISGLFVGASMLTWLLLPPADYLPEGKQGWVFAFIVPPPGQSVTAAREEFVDVVVDRLDPYLEENADMQVDAYFLGLFGSFGFAGRSRQRGGLCAVGS